ncbi:S-DNA-T family DNA segregation ATPase FtsK/SpoIIIE [Moryella indoligenes]|uniref:S-DNA-T family DNA segregation ATPase FtsK/SpoIIIE n=1 Tax=Moryella indoligenes TaxID=371674 RepID=A0AAE3VA12_9FIRM|nr:DNA translocase FtsK [Moryella indoligenes]MDQ0152481.1 S-DNA-T family DNA segregation ATPase FtsK/SpoIIIE [Moryella indoligenes]
MAQKSARKRGGSTSGRSTAGKKRRNSAEERRLIEEREEQRALIRSEGAVIFVFALSVLLFLSNFGLCGAAGVLLKGLQLGLFGVLGYIFPLLLLFCVLYGVSNRGNSRALIKLPALLLAFWVAAGLVHMLAGQRTAETGGLRELYLSTRGGGVLGGILSGMLKGIFGVAGCFLILLLLLIFLVVIITERSFVNALRQGSGRAYRHAQEDLERYREDRRLRAEERRRYLEERRERDIDLEATDFSRLAAEEGGDGAAPSLRTELPETEETVPFCPTESGERESSSDQQIFIYENAVSDAAPAETVAGTAAEAEPGDAVAKFPDLSGVLSSESDFADEDPYLREAFERADAILQRDSREGTTRASSSVWGGAAAGMAAGAFTEVSDNYEAEHTVRTVETTAPEGGAEYPSHMEATEIQPRGEYEAALYADRDMDHTDKAPWGADFEEEERAAAGDRSGQECSTAEELYAEPTDASERVVVTASGKLIQGEYQSVQKKMEEARRERRRELNREAGFAETERATEEAAQEAAASMAEQKEYLFPPLSLLEKGRTAPGGSSDLEYRSTAAKLQQTLHSFGVDVTVTNFSRGPAVTRYELLPAQGVKVGRIVALADDIKLSLAASDIRIEAPIPGKSAVGIEVPNKENNTVFLRDLLESDAFRMSRGKLSFAVGKDIGGQTVVTDIAKMPHLLIAGATGSGKSVCINTLIMSVLYRYRPEDVKLIMIDPKVVELSVYNGIPHLLIPVVTEPKKAAGALNWAVAEMTDRYKKFATTGVRDLKGYNDKILAARRSGTVNPEELPKLLPQIIIIIDELADLMMVSKNEVEEAICRIAQLARAAGMHLVIATQRPSVNVITGLIKANIPSRIAFAVSSGVDSRTILDGVGAEKLLGKGDMLFSPQGAPRPMRVQGAFVSDQEVQKVVEYIKEEELPLSYSKETVEKIVRSADSTAQTPGSGRDELFAQAGQFIIDRQKASIGNLQRMFKIGFNRAARIMDQLSEAGVVGEEQGTKPREVLMTAEQFEELLRQSE